MKPSVIMFVLAAAFAAVSVAASAQTSIETPAKVSASTVVLNDTTRLLNTLEQRRDEFKANPTTLNTFVKTEFNTIFDGNYAAHLVLGIHGRGASEVEVNDFADALIDNLTARYAQSLLGFNQRLSVRVKSESPLPGNRGVRVSSEMRTESGKVVPIDYLMRNVGGQWKVFDVMIEGISYVQTFKNQFDGLLRKKSIAEVTADLRAGRPNATGGSL